MIKIPVLIDNQATNEVEQVKARLQFLLNYAAVMVSGRGSYKALADFCGIEAASISQAVARGQISPELACRIEDAVGTKILTNAMLRRPLEVDSDDQ